MRTSARKARLVCDHIRGKDVTEARAILAFTTRGAAKAWSKLLESAVANAEHNHELVGEELQDPHRPRRRGADAQALPASRHGSRHADPQAHLAPVHHAHPEGVLDLMGQKVHPEAMRVGYIHDWKSNWFSERNFSDFLIEDVRIRDHITNKLAHAGLSDITIRKDAAEVEVNIHTARPGIVIGKSGSEVDALRRDLHRMTGKAIKVNILEIKRPELDAKLVAQSIAEQLQNRVAFRRAMKRALTSAMRSGAKGCKIQVGGRLGGAEMARSESYSDGRVPLHTLRADIDYGFYEARTTFGRIGVKCWINKGEIMPAGYAGQDLTSLDEPAGGPQQGDDDRRGGRGRDGRGRGDGRGGGGGAVAAAAAVAGWPGGGPGGRGGGGGGGRRRRRWPRRRRRRWPWRRRRLGGGGGGRGGGGGGGGRGGGRGGRGGGRPDLSRRDLPLMLSPKRVKFRKVHRGRRHGLSRGQQTVAFGDYGLKALEAGWLTNRQIEAARIAMTRKIKRGGKVWINVFPDKAFTKKPAETRMGSGKGNPEGWVAVVKPGRVMFELSGVPEDLAREAMRLAGHKLPVKTKFVLREDGQ